MPELSSKPRIALGSDHAGFPIKETIRQFLENAGYPVDDVGTWSEESVDYPDYGKAVGDKVASHIGPLWHRGLRDRHWNFHRGQQSSRNSRRRGARSEHRSTRPGT